MSWSDFLASEFVQLVQFIGSILTIIIFAGMVIKSVYRYVRKSVLPWEAWAVLVMQIGVWIAVAIYSESSWFSTVVLWAIIIMLELNSRIFQKFIERAHAHTDKAIEQAEKAMSLTKKAHNLVRRVLSIDEERSQD